MWWECKNCVSGGNSVKAMEAHQQENPDHKITEIYDFILEED